MPKGVEHRLSVLLCFAVISVESLMPKGVEHMISDLIGRGDHFRVESLMPKGVEHKYLPSSLTILACVESLMPKGVEHVLVIEYFSFAAKC